MDPQALSSLIAAGSALAGVMLSQVLPLLAARFERKRQTRLLLLAKLETMADLMNESLALSRETQTRIAVEALSSQQSVAVSDGNQSSKRARSPNSELSTSIVPMNHIHVAQRMYTLTLLYLPELKPFSYEFLQASMSLPMSSSERGAAAALERFNKAQKALDEQMAACAERYLRC